MRASVRDCSLCYTKRKKYAPYLTAWLDRFSVCSPMTESQDVQKAWQEVLRQTQLLENPPPLPPTHHKGQVLRQKQPADRCAWHWSTAQQVLKGDDNCSTASVCSSTIPAGSVGDGCSSRRPSSSTPWLPPSPDNTEVQRLPLEGSCRLYTVTHCPESVFLPVLGKRLLFAIKTLQMYSSWRERHCFQVFILLSVHGINTVFVFFPFS